MNARGRAREENKPRPEGMKFAERTIFIKPSSRRI